MLSEQDVRIERITVTPDEARFFRMLQLKAEILPGVGLAVGVRNSVDKSLPIGFCCVQWVFLRLRQVRVQLRSGHHPVEVDRRGV